MRAYLAERVNLEGYDIPTPEGEAERLAAARRIFEGEKGPEIQRVGLVEAAADWFAGLPTSLRVAWNAGDIVDAYERLHGEPCPPRLVDTVVEGFFHHMAEQFIRLTDKG